MNYPNQILSLACILEEREELEAALDVAEHGLFLDRDNGKIELARWTRKQAVTAGNRPLALKAAQEAFANSYLLVDYSAVQNLAGDQWQTIKPRLLKKLKQGWSATHKIDIYSHENMVVEAMRTLDKESFVTDYDLLRMIEDPRETHPDWGIQKCKHQAEEIMDAGQSRAYDSAVSWLSIARDIYIQHERQQEWETYQNSLLDRHFRKYKLIPMLRNIGI